MTFEFSKFVHHVLIGAVIGGLYLPDFLACHGGSGSYYSSGSSRGSGLNNRSRGPSGGGK